MGARTMPDMDLTATPVIRIPLAGIPSQCPHCHVSAAFPLAVYGHRVHAECPACFTRIAPVAVTSAEGKAS